MTDVHLRSTRLDRSTDSEIHGNSSLKITTSSFPEDESLEVMILSCPKYLHLLCNFQLLRSRQIFMETYLQSERTLKYFYISLNTLTKYSKAYGLKYKLTRKQRKILKKCDDETFWQLKKKSLQNIPSRPQTYQEKERRWSNDNCAKKSQSKVKKRFDSH